MSDKKRMREPKGFWENAWCVAPQSPPEGKFTQNDIQWSKYEGLHFAWFKYDRLANFIKGEEENHVAPTKFNVQSRNRQAWTDGTPVKCSDVIDRVRYQCQFGPKSTVNVKQKPDRKRERCGKKTGCQYSFIACRMRADTDLVCVLFHIRDHVDLQGKACHGLCGPPDIKQVAELVPSSADFYGTQELVLDLLQPREKHVHHGGMDVDNDVIDLNHGDNVIHLDDDDDKNLGSQNAQTSKVSNYSIKGDR